MLLNLVGELVINRTRISDIAATLARNIDESGETNDVAQSGQGPRRVVGACSRARPTRSKNRS